MNQSFDGRNVYTPSPDQQPYIVNVQNYPVYYYNQNLNPQQLQAAYSNMAYPIMQPPISQVSHPQAPAMDYNNFVSQAVPHRASSVQPILNNVQHVPKKGTALNIFDPNTGQKFDLENVNARKAQTSDTETSSGASSSVPITIKTPPPLPNKDEIKHEVKEQQSEAPQQSVGFTLDSDEEECVTQDTIEEVDEDDKSRSQASQSPLHEASEELADNESENSQKDESEAESQDEDAGVPYSSTSNDTKMTECFSTGNIQRYNRDQLISIRSVTDFSAVPSIPLSVFPSICSNQARPRGGRKPANNAPNKRVLNFNTNVKLDEVDNAYVPAQFAKHDKKENDGENKEELRKNIMFTLNHATGSEVGYCVEEIKKLNIKSEEDVDLLISILVNKCRDRGFRDPYAKLIKGLMELKMEGFKEKLLKKFQDHVSTPIADYIKECNTAIDKKIAESKDDKVKKFLDEDRDSTLVKNRDHFLSIVEFFSYLCAVDIVPIKTYQAAIKGFSKPKTQDEVTELIACLKIVGELLEKKSSTFFKNCMSALDNCAKTIKMESHIRFSIEDLKELQSKRWKKQEPVQQKQQPGPSQSQQQNTYGRRISTTNRPPMQQQQQQSSNRTNDVRAAIDTTNLAMSGSSSRSNFLGPPRVWSQGSNVQRQQRVTEVTSRAPNNANKQRVQPSNGAAAMVRPALNAACVQSEESPTALEARRDFIDAFTNSDNPDIDLHLAEELKPEFVQTCLCKAIESKAPERVMFVNILAHICSRNQLTFEQMAKGFEDSIQFGLDQDLPKLGEYYGELMSAVITTKFMNFTKLAAEFNKLEEDGYKRDALAQCARAASKRVGEREVATELNKTLAAGLPWGDDQSFKKPDFLKRHQLEFITNVPASSSSSAPSKPNAPSAWGEARPNTQKAAGDPAVLERIEDCLKNKNYDDLASLCSQHCKSKDADIYLRQIFMSCKSAQSSTIESVLSAVKVFIDSDNESKVLNNLTSLIPDKNEFGRWIRALVQSRLISSKALDCCSNNKLVPDSHKNEVRSATRKFRP